MAVAALVRKKMLLCLVGINITSPAVRALMQKNRQLAEESMRM